MQVYHDGVLKQAEDATLSVQDFGFSRAYALYELSRCYGQHIFYFDAHLDRLFHGLDTLGIEIPFDRDTLKAQAKHLLEIHGYEQSVIKIYVSLGASVVTKSLGDIQNFTSHVFVINDPLSIKDEVYPAGEALCKTGLKVKSTHLQRTLPTVKSTNYLAAIKAGVDALKEGCDEILFTNSEGYISECSRSNIFIVKNGALITPDSGMLFGITRMVLLKLATEIGVDVQVRPVSLDEVKSADEAFVTGSIVEMIPIQSVDGCPLMVEVEDGLTSKLRRALRGHVKTFV